MPNTTRCPTNVDKGGVCSSLPPEEYARGLAIAKARAKAIHDAGVRELRAELKAQQAIKKTTGVSVKRDMAIPLAVGAGAVIAVAIYYFAIR